MRPTHQVLAWVLILPKSFLREEDRGQHPQIPRNAQGLFHACGDMSGVKLDSWALTRASVSPSVEEGSIAGAGIGVEERGSGPGVLVKGQ